MRFLLMLLALAALTVGVPAATARRAGAGAAPAGAAAALAGEAVSVSGVVRVKAAADGAGLAPAARAVVYAESLDGAAPHRPGRFTLTQKGKTFVPRLLVAPVGSTVEFPNNDLIFHNVFSLSTPTPFDLGLYRAGASKSRTFTTPALYRVFCNIHPQMTALIAIVATTHISTADMSGAFTLELPPGRYRLTAVSERGATIAQEVRVSAGANVGSGGEPGTRTGADASGTTTNRSAMALVVDESQVQTAHRNKWGQEYPKEAWTAR